MSSCGMEVEPSGTSVSSLFSVGWQQQIIRTVEESTAQSRATIYVTPMELNAAANGTSWTRPASMVRLCSVDELANALCNAHVAENLLVIDTRSFLDFNTMRIRSAVNVFCSKMIKRRLLHNKVTIKELLKNSCDAALLDDESSRIVLYDQCTHEPALLAADRFLVVLLAKLAQTCANVGLLRGGFDLFHSRFPHLCERAATGTLCTSPLPSTSVCTPLNNNVTTSVNLNLHASYGTTGVYPLLAAAASKSSGCLSVVVDVPASRCALSSCAMSQAQTLAPAISANSGAVSEPSTPIRQPCVARNSNSNSNERSSNTSPQGASPVAATPACATICVNLPSTLKRNSAQVEGAPLAFAERARLLSPGAGSSGALSGPCLPVTHTGPSRILPYLFLGSQMDAFDTEVIKTHGITHVINVSATCPQTPHVRPENFLRISVNDSFYERLNSHFRKAADFIERARAENGCILVHCLAGISRSPTITIAYVMRAKNMSSDEAYKLVKRARPAIAPNFNFLGQLLEYERQLKMELQSLGACENSPSASPSFLCGSAHAHSRISRFSFSGSGASLNSVHTGTSTQPSSASYVVRPSVTCESVAAAAASPTVERTGPASRCVTTSPLVDEQVAISENTRKVSANSFAANVTTSTSTLRHVETILCNSALRSFSHSVLDADVPDAAAASQQPANTASCDSESSSSSKRQCLPQTRSLDSGGEKCCALISRRLLVAKSSAPKLNFSAIRDSQAPHVDASAISRLATQSGPSVAPAKARTPTTPVSELARLSFDSENTPNTGTTQPGTDVFSSATQTKPTVSVCEPNGTASAGERSEPGNVPTQPAASSLLLNFDKFATATCSLRTVQFTTCCNASDALSVRSATNSPVTPGQHHSMAAFGGARTPSPSRRPTMLFVDNSNAAHLQAASVGNAGARRCSNERENLITLSCDARAADRSWKSLTNVSANGYCAENAGQLENNNNVVISDGSAKPESNRV